MPSNPVNSDGWPEELTQYSLKDGTIQIIDWHETVSNVFSSSDKYERLYDACFYPCFSPSRQILRRPSSLLAHLYDRAGTLHATHSPSWIDSHIWLWYTYFLLAAATAGLLIKAAANIETRWRGASLVHGAVRNASRYLLPVLALLFVVWIECYIWHDGPLDDNAYTVGQ